MVPYKIKKPKFANVASDMIDIMMCTSLIGIFTPEYQNVFCLPSAPVLPVSFSFPLISLMYQAYTNWMIHTPSEKRLFLIATRTGQKEGSVHMKCMNK